MYLNERFKNNFKEESAKNRHNFILKLLDVFELPEYHFARSILEIYYQKYPKLLFKKTVAEEILKDMIGSGGFYFLDFTKENRGGYQTPQMNKDYYSRDSKNVDNNLQYSNWISFLETLKEKYWEEDSKLDSYITIGNFMLYEDRKPKTIREKALENIIIDGVEIRNKYFNNTFISRYYRELFTKFFPKFSLINGISNAKIKRYGKKICNDLYLGLYVDYGLLKRELNMGYLELPRIEIELFSKNFDTYVKPDSYVVSQDKFDIGRINFNYFMGNRLKNYRIGNSSQQGDLLKKDLFFYMEVNAYYLEIYLDEVEHIVCRVLNT